MSRAKNQRVDRQEKLVHEVVLHERLEEGPAAEHHQISR